MRRLGIVLAAAAVYGTLAGGTAGLAETRAGALPHLRVACGSANIREAWLAEPTARYRHFVLGAPTRRQA
jgi:hypothetical protein